MVLLCDNGDAQFLSSTAVLSDSVADHVLVPAARARLGLSLQPRLRSVLVVNLLAHGLPQVLDNAQDLLAAQLILVEPASHLEHQVVHPALCELLHRLAQALPALLPRPRALPAYLTATPPRQLQVVPRAAAQSHQLPAGRLPVLPRRAPAAAPHHAGQPLPHLQVDHRHCPQLAHAAAQDLPPPPRLRDQHRRPLPAPACLATCRPTASCPWILSARLVYQVVSLACTARPNLCLCSVDPAAYLRSQLAPLPLSHHQHLVHPALGCLQIGLADMHTGPIFTM